MVRPDDWLAEAVELIKEESSAGRMPRRVLDVACGIGNNAIWLAKQGFQVDAVDISPPGLQLAKESAALHDVQVRWIEADLDNWLPERLKYDIVVVFRFLDRVAVPSVVRTALRPEGWLVYETFSAGQCARRDNQICNPAFTLSPGELPSLFAEFEVFIHREAVLEDRSVDQLLARRDAES